MRIPKEIQSFLASDKRALQVGKSGIGSQACVAQGMLAKGRNVVAVFPGQKELDRFWSLVTLFSGQSEQEGVLWERPWVKLDAFRPGSTRTEQWGARWAALSRLKLGSQPCGLALTADNFLPYWPPSELVDQAYLYLVLNEDIEIEDIATQLVAWGYDRVGMVTRFGEFAVRGDILDIYTPGYESPVRLEFFGDTLEGIRLFEPLSQRSKQSMTEVTVMPAAPALGGGHERDRIRDKWHHLWTTGALDKQVKARLEQHLEDGEAGFWPGLYYQRPVLLEDWLPSDPVFMLCEADTLRSYLEEEAGRWQTVQQVFANGEQAEIPSELVVRTPHNARQAWLEGTQILFETLPVEPGDSAVALPEKRYTRFEDLFWRPDQKRRPWHTLCESLKTWRRTTHQTILLFDSVNAQRKFLSLIEKEGVQFQTSFVPDQKGLYALVMPFDGGMELPWRDMLVLGEEVLQPRQERAVAQKQTARDFKGLSSFDDLQTGELLVHRDYGLSRFGGLQRLQADQAGQDYLVLEYADSDKLYVPADRLNLVQRYQGGEGAAPALDRLGGTSWQKTTKRVRKAIEQIAHELVRMYAYRRVAKGFAYSAADELYREFEASFGFAETPDQEKVISDVLEDMDSPEPMDRLVCGDVGFGKTEIAMRAAFRAVADSKQVALLCPTTVLAEQHYQNFRQRMEPFEVRVGLLSRFVPKAQQRKTLEAAGRGEIDILIGTHRLLSQDVRLPQQSLLILDEEQRFGVKHKEKLKEIRKTLDVLTLTATPIPRTLQLSLSGVRSLSVIETPPPERKAVESSLIEREPGRLQEILQREVDRGGQVFFVHNRVRGLAEVRDMVQHLVPEARVGMAHGQMAERRLEESMHRFWHGELDILVCTAIIESGLDFPRANTLIVDQAHMFGLGQLYQLRGRVGRSKRQAYAYFVVPSLDNLPADARKRLQAILEADYLGAGIQVAMRDLQLRGAGNLLGESQSGQISKVGLDLFLEMLEEEVRKIRGEALPPQTDPELQIGFAAHIPESFVPDTGERLRYYKALSSAGSQKERETLLEELQDRFGVLPEPLLAFAAVLQLKGVLARLQAERVQLYPQRVVVSWSEEVQAVDPARLVAWVGEQGDRARLQPPAKLELRLPEKQSIADAVTEISRELEGLLPSQTK
ncbi:transcription-repair coupling factor [Desulfohalobium retbaense]|uniref:Transcription-repair-coupling factor n=1 Tax=Desulfohalobium retbaense (strain ATCC 49708 / DSM 5692 / JCM 16813 / HR100) TaxID=485915 RepID=C8X3H8_DESRD|nr:transcription-repair coupling factor [Desulfohalobium retbaense]ACV68975.1 transcription-repair coupling factor [Desulfohalobium retbaense DSM 5692]